MPSPEELSVASEISIRIGKSIPGRHHVVFNVMWCRYETGPGRGLVLTCIDAGGAAAVYCRWRDHRARDGGVGLSGTIPNDV